MAKVNAKNLFSNIFLTTNWGYPGFLLYSYGAEKKVEGNEVEFLFTFKDEQGTDGIEQSKKIFRNKMKKVSHFFGFRFKVIEEENGTFPNSKNLAKTYYKVNVRITSCEHPILSLYNGSPFGRGEYACDFEKWITKRMEENEDLWDEVRGAGV